MRPIITDGILAALIIFLAYRQGKKGLYGIVMPVVIIFLAIKAGTELAGAILDSFHPEVPRVLLTAASILGCYVILRILKRILGKAADWFAVGWINHACGFVIGLAAAVILILAVVRLCGHFHIVVFQNLAQGTRLLDWFVNGDIGMSLERLRDLLTESSGTDMIL